MLAFKAKEMTCMEMRGSPDFATPGHHLKGTFETTQPNTLMTDGKVKAPNSLAMACTSSTLYDNTEPAIPKTPRLTEQGRSQQCLSLETSNLAEHTAADCTSPETTLLSTDTINEILFPLYCRN